MSKGAVWVVAMKDIKDIRSSVQIWLPMIIVPIVFCVAMPAAILIGLRYWNMRNLGDVQDMVRMLERLPSSQLRESIMKWDSIKEQVAFFAVNYLFAPLFLLVPLMASSVITANSFVGEKERKTLESLLFSPVEIPDLFLAKILSAFIPSMGLTLFCTFLYGIVVNVLGYPLFGQAVFPTGNWFVLVLWTTPALSLFTILLNVFISARVRGFQEAYQMGGLVVLPVIGLVVSQAVGVLMVDTWLLWWLGAGFFVIDFLFLRSIGRRLDRNLLFETQVQ